MGFLNFNFQHLLCTCTPLYIITPENGWRLKLKRGLGFGGGDLFPKFYGVLFGT